MATYSGLIRKSAPEAGLPIETTDRAAKCVFVNLVEMVETEGPLIIPGFGTFDVATHKARKGRNVRTGEPVDVPERRVLKFRPAKAVRERLNP
jgi:nucleoid DNA-binding protein